VSKTQIITLVVAAVLSWYGMMAVHETGHCLGTMLTGAEIERVVIPVAGFSRTDFSGGKSPLLVVWAGPVVGAILPTILLAFVRTTRPRIRHVLMFFAGFCLLANGVYLGFGAFLRAGDCRQLLQHGSPAWLLVAFGVICVIGGLYTWHRMGSLRDWFAGANGPKLQSVDT